MKTNSKWDKKIILPRRLAETLNKETLRSLTLKQLGEIAGGTTEGTGGTTLRPGCH